MWETLATGLPHCTALLNTSATIVLAMALVNIKRGRVKVHKKLMLIALGISAAFLALYLLHKVALFQTTGEPNKRFPTDAPQSARYTYFAILGTHLVLAIFVPFLALRAVYLAKKGRIVAHKKLVRWAYPIWMYVSVTGVLVYLMLYQLYPA
ncbi:DUF420 domain-containing protein [Roseiconus lacunae]|uniref:DUF420 domain-containing protein n=1 Tax=Roseiconus lacunae TaxID=2605694 RepID=A0ABT7PJE7_9BACT|nr:DUF420 domain-containing protein [Roseiconus lacunae]MCD0458418.1 DUF420 domain-containing protein [Roseiconus lacunae]MDM4016306.1 DUF420 domain-containing protein [Roseiconus lacunae]WRQ52091.1 DUF420 domain-containing protein [Stieleria sp. HD01]